MTTKMSAMMKIMKRALVMIFCHLHKLYRVHRKHILTVNGARCKLHKGYQPNLTQIIWYKFFH